MSAINSLFLGFLSAAFSLVAEVFASLYLSSHPFIFEISPQILAAVFIEEIMKLAIIRKTLTAGSAPAKLISFVLFGVGFSLLEIFLNLWKLGAADSHYFAFLGIAAVHVATAVLIGTALKKPGRLRLVAFLLAANILIHLSYNALVLLNLP